jgi:hypothetical protein
VGWLAFSYTLPSKGQSSSRVALWRRLKRLGAIAPTSGTYLLPEGAEYLEGFQWLLQEVRKDGGESLVMRVSTFEGLSDAELQEKFNAARGEEYASVETDLAELEARLRGEPSAESRPEALEALEWLRKRHAEIARVDFFNSRRGASLADRLSRLGKRLVMDPMPEVHVEPVDRRSLIGKVWVTRPNPHVDRLASIWLVRRFIDPTAEIRYRERAEGDEVSFDMPDARFGHVGNLCTFETLLAAFGLSDAALQAVAEIVHEIDLRDSHYARPEVAGMDAVLEGWRQSNLSDEEQEQHGVALFDGLHTALLTRAQHSGRRNQVPGEKKGESTKEI